MQPSDIARLIDVSDPKVSPDGRRVAFVVSRVDIDESAYRSAVWLAAIDGSTAPVQLTAGADRDSSPAWSPDGTRLAFTRSPSVPTPGEPPRHSLHVVPVAGPGEVVTVASGEDAVQGVRWSPDGTRLAYAQRVRDARYEPDDDRLRPPRRIEVLQNRLDTVGWTTDRRAHVFVVAVDGTEPPRQLSDGPYEHGAPAWSPDGEWIASAAGRHDGWDLDFAVDLWLFSASASADESPRRITDQVLTYSEPAFSPDGTRIACLRNDIRTGPRHTQVVMVDVSSGNVTSLTEGLDRHCAPLPGRWTPAWTTDDAVLFSIEDHGRVPVMKVAGDGSNPPVEIIGGDRWVGGFDVAGRDIVAFTASTSTQPSELYSVVEGEERQLTSFQAAFIRATSPLTPEPLAVSSPAGDGDIDAWILRPPGFDASQTYPMLLQVHGGPGTQHGEHFFDEVQLYASAGYVVVYSNPHGSTGSTEAWVRSIRSPRAEVDPGTGWGGIDYDDLMAVVDAAIEHEPAIDRDRLGVLGGSYGGYMTSWIIGHNTRFAAACSERSVNNLWTEEWTCDFAGVFRIELGIDPFADMDEYLRMSPVSYVKQIETPVLILHSEDDLRCNIEQADQLFVMLRLLGKEHEYWRFPAESHELSRSGSPKHRVQRFEIILDWFNRWLKP